MVALADRLKGVHPRALYCVTKTAKYVSPGLQEYRILPDGAGYWYIYAYRQPHQTKMDPTLRGKFTSFRQCEDILIRYLQKKDKFGNRAVYPEPKDRGKPPTE